MESFDGTHLITNLDYDKINRDFRILDDDDIDAKCFICNQWGCSGENHQFKRFYGKFQDEKYNTEKIVLNDLTDEQYKVDLGDDSETKGDMIEFMLYFDCCLKCYKEIELKFNQSLNDICMVYFQDKGKYMVHYVSTVND